MNQSDLNDVKSPEQLEREADLHRARLSSTFHELESKFDSSHIIDEAVNMVTKHSADVANSVVKTVKENPIPSMLIASGLAWMIANKFRGTKKSAQESRATLVETRKSVIDPTIGMDPRVVTKPDNKFKSNRKVG